MTSSFAMEPICSFHNERMIVAVSSPTTASQTFLGSPNLPMTSLASPTLITLASTFTCFEFGVRSRTFVRGLSTISGRLFFRVSRFLEEPGHNPTLANTRHRNRTGETLESGWALGFLERLTPGVAYKAAPVRRHRSVEGENAACGWDGRLFRPLRVCAAGYRV